MNRSKFHQYEVINRDLQTKFISKPSHLTPNIQNITLHFSIKFQEDRLDLLYPILQIIETISGQKAQLHFSKKTLHRFRLNRGIISGISTKLRKDSIYAFLENFKTIIFPSSTLPGFTGIPKKSFDNRGNLTLNINNLMVFPEIEEEFQKFQLGTSRNFTIGLDISFHTTAKNISEGETLFSALQFPFDSSLLFLLHLPFPFDSSLLFLLHLLSSCYILFHLLSSSFILLHLVGFLLLL